MQCGVLLSILKLAPEGIEPTSKVPETFVLSIERRSLKCAYSCIIPLFCQEQHFGNERRGNKDMTDENEVGR